MCVCSLDGEFCCSRGRFCFLCPAELLALSSEAVGWRWIDCGERVSLCLDRDACVLWLRLRSLRAPADGAHACFKNFMSSCVTHN